MAFSLVNTGDVGADASMQLVASVTDPANPTGPAISSAALTQNYVETTPDPFVDTTTETVTGSPETDPDSGLTVNVYYGSNAAAKPDHFVLSGAYNYVFEGTENNLIAVTTPPGNSIIIGDTFSPSGTLLLNGASTLADAIEQASADNAGTQQRGDLVATASGNDTIVGGDGNSAYLLGGGRNVIYTGAGDDTVWGGYFLPGGTGSYAEQFNWTTSVTPYQVTPFTIGNTTIEVPAYTFYGPAGLTSDIETNEGGAAGADTVMAGDGNDVIAVPYGPNYVVGGAGNDTLLGGDGGNTIFGGAGASTIEGGLGNDYIDTGTGADLVVGNGGNDTIMGGGGNASPNSSIGMQFTWRSAPGLGFLHAMGHPLEGPGLGAYI